MCDSQVNGSASSADVKAHRAPCHVNPCTTCTFSVTYSGSSHPTNPKWRTGAYTVTIAAIRIRQASRTRFERNESVRAVNGTGGLAPAEDCPETERLLRPGTSRLAWRTDGWLFMAPGPRGPTADRQSPRGGYRLRRAFSQGRRWSAPVQIGRSSSGKEL